MQSIYNFIQEYWWWIITPIAISMLGCGWLWIKLSFDIENAFHENYEISGYTDGVFGRNAIYKIKDDKKL